MTMNVKNGIGPFLIYLQKLQKQNAILKFQLLNSYYTLTTEVTFLSHFFDCLNS